MSRFLCLERIIGSSQMGKVVAVGYMIAEG